jgi:hypothetical protein
MSAIAAATMRSLVSGSYARAILVLLVAGRGPRFFMVDKFTP